MYAILETGGKQYRIKPGNYIDVEKLPFEVDQEVSLGNILMVSSKEQGLRMGAPYVDGVRAIGRVLKQFRGPKIVVFKHKPKSNYRKKQGHRQSCTRVQIERIEG